jgi:small subunit ribosomal protein S9
MTNIISQYYGLGRRKTSRARVWLVAGQADHQINARALRDYFPTIDMQQAAQAPLLLTSQKEGFGITAIVSGGGKRAQADAVKMGVARALLTIDTKWRKQLKDVGYLRRDPRMKERKKPGLKRARRAPQFSKR